MGTLKCWVSQFLLNPTYGLSNVNTPKENLTESNTFCKIAENFGRVVIGQLNLYPNVGFGKSTYRS